MNRFITLIATVGISVVANAQTLMMVETDEGTYSFDIDKVKQVYFKTAEKDVIKPFFGETTIYDDAKIGDKGLIDGQEVIVAELGETKLAIATCNYGAKYPEADGKYINFKNAIAYSENHTWGETWRLPTLQEFQTLMYDDTMEVKPFRMVPGCTWYIGPNRTELFFPFSGEMSYGELSGKNEVGYYWSSNKAGDGAWCMGISAEDDPADATFYINAYSTDLLSVRLVSELKSRPLK